MFKRWHRSIQYYFSFSSRETNAFLLLVPLTALIIISPYLYRQYLLGTVAEDPFNQVTMYQLDSLRQILRVAEDRPVSMDKRTALTPVKFDPNAVTISEMKAMGFSERLATTIVNYRSKGGQFRIKKDLARIYGLKEDQFLQLYDFIDLPEKLPHVRKSTPRPSNPSPVVEVIEMKDLNAVTADDLMAVKGIGEILSRRIVSFRSGLGGFHTLDQLSEVYGLNDEVIGRLRTLFVLSDTIPLTTMNVNEVGRQELARHPYIDYKTANLIIAFRDQRRLRTVNDLRQIKVMTDSLYLKLSPYLSVGVQ